MMTENDIEKLAEELVSDMMVAQSLPAPAVAHNPEITCPHCHYGRLRRCSVEGVTRCPNCRAYSGDKFDFNFPTWAQGKKKFFRRTICLVFNIQAIKPAKIH